ncbi:MAG TPA: hypothetical protein VF601_03960 [Beijerinckiaceae bacterium]|jgi:hypothetical protein
MHARRPDFIPERQPVLDLRTMPEALVPKRDEPAPAPAAAPADAAKPKRSSRWPAAALVAALAVNGLWVALLLWLLGRWIGVV